MCLGFRGWGTYRAWNVAVVTRPAGDRPLSRDLELS